MAIELKVPAVGESVSEIYIGKWYKAEGDSIAVDEGLVELESDKATLDVPSPSAGVLKKILKQTGDTAQVGEVIGYIETNGAAAAPKPAPAESAPAAEPPKTAEPATPPPTPERAPASSQERPRIEIVDDKPKVGSHPSESSPVVEHQPVRPAEPAARQREATPQPAATAPGVGAPEGDRAEEAVPLSPVRRRIAARLVEAQHTAALLTTFNEIDMTAVKEIRSQYGDSFQKRHGVKLGFMSFFVKA
ncbi:MAG TPA: biotin/lipoyl-containing protein, partial [Lacipirellula sp.]